MQRAVETVRTERAAVDHTLQRDRASVDTLRMQLAQSTHEIRQSLDEASAVRAEVDKARRTADELAGRYAALGEDASGLREQTTAAMAAVSRVESTVASLAEVRDLAVHTEDRVAALNALAEHVMQKTQSLDGQKHAVDRAVVQANRLNEMVWNMDVQIDKLNDGLKQITRGEQAAARIRQVVEDTQTRADAAAQARDEFIRETARFEREGRALMGVLAGSVEKLALYKNDFDAFDRRLGALQTSVGEAETRLVSVAAREQDLGAMDRRIETLALELRLLTTQAADLAGKQATLDSLQARLRDVDDLSRRTASQHDELQKSRFDLDALRSEAEDVRRIHTEIARMRDHAAQDRSALEAFAGRLAAFRAQIPELDATTDAILGKLDHVDEGFRKAVRVEEIAAGLDAQLASLATRFKVVDRIEGRLDALHTFTDDVDRKLAGQLARRSELDILKDRCDAIAAQVLDAQQKVEAVDTLRSKLAGLSDRVAQTQEHLEQVQERFADVKADEATLTGQQARLGVLVEQSRMLMAEVADRMTQVRAGGDELAASESLKQQLSADLARLETRQREVAMQSEAVEEQLRKAEVASRLLDQRHSQLVASERKLAEVEERIAGTMQKAGEVDRRMAQLLDRDDALTSIKAEIADLHRMTTANKADLQFLLEHRQDIAAMRPQMDTLLANAAEVQERITAIESRRKAVEEVQARTYTVMNLFEDVRLNLETMGAHKAIIDDVTKKIGGLGFAVQEAESMLRSLKHERQLAEQVEDSIKQLR
jgi:chromosome segregation ATPase